MTSGPVVCTPQGSRPPAIRRALVCPRDSVRILRPEQIVPQVEVHLE